MEELDKQPEEIPEESAGLAGYAPDERILVLMRDFLGDNQKKAEYQSRVKLLRNFIKNSEDHLGDPRLKEINTDLASLRQEIIREKFLKEQLTTLLLPKADLTTIDKKAIHSRLFSKLTLRELEKYAASSDTARKQVNAYYESLFSTTPDKAKLLEYIQSPDVVELKLFLESLSKKNRLSLELFEPVPVGVFDPLLYLNIHGHQQALDIIYSSMDPWIEAYVHDENYWDRLFRMKIRTGQRINNVLASWWGYPDGWRESILALAYEYEDHQTVETLCELRPEFMLSAITEGNFARVQELVEHGANPATMPQDEAGRRLRMNFYEIAINTDQNEIAQYLIDHSMADILAKNGNRGRVFAVACAAQNIEMLRYLCEKTKGNPGVENISNGGVRGIVHNRTALQHACYWGNVEAVGLLLDMNFPVDVVSNPAEDVSVLFFACRYAHTNKAAMLKIVQLILAKNSTLAFINTDERWFGKTALLMAYVSGNREVIELLLQKGAAFTFGHTVNSVRVIRHTVHDIDTLKTIPIDLLERYTKKNPQHKIARRLLNVLTRVEGEAPLTWREKVYLNIALFFNTELGFIYDTSRNFCLPESKPSEAVPLLNEDNSQDDDVPLDPAPTPTPTPTKTVREQAEWLEEVFGPAQVFEEETTHETQVGGVSGELEPVKPFEDQVAYFDRRTPPPSPPLPRGENLKNDNNAVDGSKKSPGSSRK